ncbi:SLBB domain-containing protein [Pedobacter boryungensis]|uniref:SLBB domain-containing protein n=1 Tax=Pedobacter boryungensis TaxID=869962 RepID=A0ABX2DFF8_9SPHI|nr:SLBB domain-containing protein [Pedobacter boryungensis]NQX32772.1 SLBB domain-containing protein [Pedobacter boryungensis]
MKKNILQLFTILLVILSFNSTVLAQSNYANVKVDELSDTRILEIVKQGESIGFTSEAQLEQMALARGMKAEEVRKFKLRVEKLRNQNNSDQSSSTNRTYNEDQSIVADTVGKNRKNESLTPKIFGSDLFRNGNITFEPNLRIATPKGYIIGPDDKLIIDLTGDNEKTYNLQVSPEGIINLEFVGRIAVGGLSIEQAASKIRSLMSSTYPALRSGRTTVAVNLGNIRSIKVTITGQVVKAGTYTISSLSTVYNALGASGGPSTNGSYRNIQVIRNNKVVSTVDVYDFLLAGIQRANIRLQDQDVIYIPVFEKRVEIQGEVVQPALFEVKNGESLQDVINFASGFTPKAYTAQIKNFQNTDKERRISDISSSAFNTYIPKNGDVYLVEPILDRFENRVEIEGAVFRPGQYELEKGLTLKALINKAAGLTEDAFLNRGYINRLNADNTPSLISFDVAKLMAGTITDISLQREDKVTISSIFDLRDEYKITIQGEVRAPGVFNYADSMSLESVIQMAGGFKEGATAKRIEISRRIKNSDASSASARTAQVITVNVDQNLKIIGDRVILKPFDVISVRSSTGYQVQKQVIIEGEVLYPGPYTIMKKNERISDLIKRAGGLTPSAYTDGASLKRPGADNVNPTDKNAINNKEEEEKKLLSLKRIQEAGVKDTLTTEVEQKLIQSDLVGINLTAILEKPLSKQDLIVEDGDIIRIPRQLQVVKVTGEVLSPNSIVYLTGKSFKDYINGAGGFTDKALKNKAYVKYANGTAAGAKKFLFFNNYPRIKPGAEIFVPKAADKQPLNAQAWIGIGTAIASLGAIIVSLLK